MLPTMYGHPARLQGTGTAWHGCHQRGHSSQAATACAWRGSSANTRCAPHAGSTPPALQCPVPAGRAGSRALLSPGCPLRAGQGMLAAGCGWQCATLVEQRCRVGPKCSWGHVPPCPRWQGCHSPATASFHPVLAPAGTGPALLGGTPRLFMVSPCCRREPGGQACL